MRKHTKPLPVHQVIGLARKSRPEGLAPSFQTLRNADLPSRDCDIEELLWWVYQRQCAHVLPDFKPSRALAIKPGPDLSVLGTRVQGGAQMSADVHPDAEAMHEKVKKLPDLQRGLVIHHALAGTRPDWADAEVVTVGPVLKANGKPTVVLDVGRRPVYCAVYLSDPGFELRTFARKMYETWHGALTYLQEGLSLSSFTPKPPEAKKTPWVAFSS